MKNNQTAGDVKRALLSVAGNTAAISSSYFFKTGKGEYGEGDTFLDITVPAQRKIAKNFLGVSFSEIEKLLASPVHEHRSIALFILVYHCESGDQKLKDQIFKFYIAHTSRINNWDLVDCSCRVIVGDHLPKRNRALLYKLAKSKNIWERRIAIVSTYAYIRQNDLEDTFAISLLLLNDTEDLIHKAVGWMLREAGKRKPLALHDFLKKHAKAMPRTTLRYAIEKFPPDVRKAYLHI